jgi:DNA-binding LacI/PurR family transcriptional regulator
MVSLAEIAKKAGVSQTTVHYVLNDPHRISVSVREKVLKVVYELGYFKDKKVKLKNFGLVCENYADFYTGEYYDWIILGIQKRLSELKFQMQIFEGFEVDYAEVNHLNGIIFVGNTKQEYLDRARAYHLPFVVVAHPPSRDTAALTVYLDNQQPCIDLLEYVVSCGHRHIAFMRGELGDNNIIDRNNLNAYTEVLAKQKLTASIKNVFPVSYSHIQESEIAWNAILNLKPKVTCIICSNDLLAYFCYQHAVKYNVRVPQDISITGYDGIFIPRHVGSLIKPKLTTVSVDRILLGKTGVDLLLEEIQKPLRKRIHMLPGELNIGDSVRRIK